MRGEHSEASGTADFTEGPCTVTARTARHASTPRLRPYTPRSWTGHCQLSEITAFGPLRRHLPRTFSGTQLALAARSPGRQIPLDSHEPENTNQRTTRPDPRSNRGARRLTSAEYDHGPFGVSVASGSRATDTVNDAWSIRLSRRLDLDQHGVMLVRLCSANAWPPSLTLR